MKDINQVILRGRIGNIKVFGRENNVASISVATTENYKDKSGKWNEVVSWHRVKAFSSNPAIPPFDTLEKGMNIQVAGKLTYNSYTDRDGVTKESVDIQADEIILVEDLRMAAGRNAQPQKAHNYEEDF